MNVFVSGLLVLAASAAQADGRLSGDAPPVVIVDGPVVHVDVSDEDMTVDVGEDVADVGDDTADAGDDEVRVASELSDDQDAEQARRDADQARRDADQDKRDHEQERRDREQEKRDREQEKRDRENAALDRADQVYENAQEHLNDEEWEQAIRGFAEAARVNAKRADAALYWKGYAQFKRGLRAEVLATLAELRKAYPNSSWLSDAKALELEARGASAPSAASDEAVDEDLRLIAITSLLNSDPERAVPLLEKFLEGAHSPKLKDKALFVLVQTGSPRAREIVTRIARGESNPSLQRAAIKYLGLFGGRESSTTLATIYTQSSDVQVKTQILHSFMTSGDRTRVLEVARTEKQPELRRAAIQLLGVMGGQDELWDLYKGETDIDLKRAMLQGMFVGGNADRLIELAKTEKNPELRRVAVRNLGLMGERTGPALVTIYQTDADRDVRENVLQAFFLQNNAKALVTVARQEKDPELKRAAVSKLSLMQNKDATDFMIEILSK